MEGQQSPPGNGGGGLAERYASAAAARLLVGDVEWQFGALQRGFWAGAMREVSGPRRELSS